MKINLKNLGNMLDGGVPIVCDLDRGVQVALKLVGVVLVVGELVIVLLNVRELDGGRCTDLQ